MAVFCTKFCWGEISHRCILCVLLDMLCTVPSHLSISVAGVHCFLLYCVDPFHSSPWKVRVGRTFLFSANFNVCDLFHRVEKSLPFVEDKPSSYKVIACTNGPVPIHPY